MHVGQVQVEQDDVVIIQLAEVQTLFAQIGRIDVEAFGGEHQLDRLGSGRFVFDQQNAHFSPRNFGACPRGNPRLGEVAAC